MSASGKFTFGEDFGRRAAAPLTLSASERARADGEARARAAGVTEGRAQAQRELDQRVAKGLETVAARIAALMERIETIEAAALDGAVDFAMRFSQATTGVALRRFPLAALEAAALETFAHARQTPHCVVRLHESLIERANEMLARVARERGFEGRLVVMGESALAAGDFSLEWADGGVSRDGEALRRGLADAIERHITASMATNNPGGCQT